MAAVLVVAVVAVAYGSAAPQLAVAEFSPSAQKTLEAPATTAADTSAGPSAGRPGRTTTTVPPTTAAAADPTGNQATPPTTRTARTRACVGNPPRQTEDPMSPPCMTAIFEGDNGGNTARGVTTTEIRVAVPSGLDLGNPASSYRRPIEALFQYFNQRYELYGRRLVPVYVAASTPDALTARALAATLAAQNPFAVLTGPLEWYNQPMPAMASALARDGILSITRSASAWWSDRTIYDALHPYVWSTYPSSEDLQTNLADLTCTALAGQAARNAGDDVLRTKTRRFGVLAVGQNAPPNTGLLRERLTSCTGTAPALMEISNFTSAPADAWRNGFTRLKDDGVTTIFCVCEFYSAPGRPPQAHGIGYHPEWILTPTQQATGNDENWIQRLRTSGEIAPPVRLSAGPRLIPLQARPWFAAAQSIDAGVFTNPSDVYGTFSMPEFVYDQLLILVSGIQGAGPQLTPETFAAALMATQFPNPGSGQPPYWQPSAGFGPGDHSLYDDYTVAWWSDAAPALDYPVSPQATGSWCYLNAGERFRAGSYPADADARLFNSAEPCR